MWYVACTRARDVLILPHLTAGPQRSWSRILDLGHARLPELNLDALPDIAPTPRQVVTNLQTPEIFATEATRINVAAQKSTGNGQATTIPTGLSYLNLCKANPRLPLSLPGLPPGICVGFSA